MKRFFKKGEHNGVKYLIVGIEPESYWSCIKFIGYIESENGIKGIDACYYWKGSLPNEHSIARYRECKEVIGKGAHWDLPQPEEVEEAIRKEIEECK